MRFSILFLFCLLASQQSQASQEHFALDKLGTVRIEVPKGWTSIEKRLRAPLLLAAPMAQGESFRAVLTLYPIEGLSAEQVIEAAGSVEAYRKAKRDWADKNHGSVVEFASVTTEDWAHFGKVRRLGFTYELSGKRFEERSYYFHCAGKAVHAKMLLPLGKRADADRIDAEGALRSLSCD